MVVALFNRDVIDRTVIPQCHVEGVYLESSSTKSTSQCSDAQLVCSPSKDVVNPNRFEEDDTRFFSSFGGSSWHRADVAFIFWVLSPLISTSLEYLLPETACLLTNANSN